MFPADVFVIRDYLLLMICYGQVWMILLPHATELFCFKLLLKTLVFISPLHSTISPCIGFDQLA